MMNEYEEIIQKLEDVYNDVILENNQTNERHALIAAQCEKAFRELAGMYRTAKRELTAAHKRIGELNDANGRKDAYWMIDYEDERKIVCSHCGSRALRSINGEQKQSDYCPNCGRIMTKRTAEELELEECPHCGGIARFEVHTGDPFDVFPVPTVVIVCSQCGCRTKGKTYEREADAEAQDSIEKAKQTEAQKWNGGS